MSYGVFQNEFCSDDNGCLIHIESTEEMAARWMENHCIPGGLKYYTVEELPEIEPSHVVREEDIDLGYIWELENGLFVVLNLDGDEATLSLRLHKSDIAALDRTGITVYADDEGEYDWDAILGECEEKMEDCGWAKPSRGLRFCVSEYITKIDSQDCEIGGVDEYSYWYDTLDEAIAAKEKFMESMKCELASHFPCARAKEKGHVCVEAWNIEKGEKMSDAFDQLSDSEKEKMNAANENTEICGRDL